MATAPLRAKEGGAQPDATPLEGTMSETKAEGERLASDAKEAIAGVAEQRKKAAAEYMRSMAAAIESGAGRLEQEGRSGTASLVRQTSTEIGNLASRVIAREPQQMVRDVEEFVRRRPGLAFGVAAVAAFGIMRFLKSSRDRTGEHSGHSASVGPASVGSGDDR